MTHPSDPTSPHDGTAPEPVPADFDGPARPASADAPADADSSADGDAGARASSDADPAADPDAEATPARAEAPEDAITPEGTVILVRRRRMPSLAFWVLGSMLLAALAGVVVALVADVGYLAGIAYFAVTSAVFFGLPLAAFAALIDALRHRRTDRRR